MKIRKIYIYLLYLVLFFSATRALAQNQTTGGASGNQTLGIDPFIKNPLKANSFEQLAVNIIEVLIKLGLPISILFIIYAGFLFVTARGNENQIENAKKTLLWAVVGTAVLLGSLVIASAIKGTVTQLEG